jgi:hypothetical protein
MALLFVDNPALVEEITCELDGLLRNNYWTVSCRCFSIILACTLRNSARRFATASHFSCGQVCSRWPAIFTAGFQRPGTNQKIDFSRRLWPAGGIAGCSSCDIYGLFQKPAGQIDWVTNQNKSSGYMISKLLRRNLAVQHYVPQGWGRRWHNDRLLDRTEIAHWTASNANGGLARLVNIRCRLNTGGRICLQCATSITKFPKPLLSISKCVYPNNCFNKVIKIYKSKSINI